MLGIVLGSAVVFLTRKEMSGLLQNGQSSESHPSSLEDGRVAMDEDVVKSLLGFAAGVMVSASFWSLLLPAVEMQGDTKWAVVPAVIGFLLGSIRTAY